MTQLEQAKAENEKLQNKVELLEHENKKLIDYRVAISKKLDDALAQVKILQEASASNAADGDL